MDNEDLTSSLGTLGPDDLDYLLGRLPLGSLFYSEGSVVVIPSS